MVSDLLLPNRKRKNRNWKKDVLPHVNERLMAFRQEGVLPTVRGMFYALVSLQVLNNTNSDYVQLDSKLTDWRENGTIPPYSFVDNSRSIIDIDDDFRRPKEYVEAGISYLDNAPKGYYDSIPRWYNQPHYVEVWIEKDAMTGTFISILKDRHVRIVPNRGWTGFEFLNNNIERLMKKQNEEGKSVHVMYFGDYDPSGDRMYRWLKEKLSDAGIEIKRVAITKEQIDEFNLGHLKNTDRAVMAKLLKDNNTDEFRRNNEGQVYQIELDALLALQPTKLKQLVLSVDQYFVEEIFEEVLNEVSPEDISCLVKELVKSLS
jgi:5S rRNA maturation endonuclease (ribonuclease M5)